MFADGWANPSNLSFILLLEGPFQVSAWCPSCPFNPSKAPLCRMKSLLLHPLLVVLPKPGVLSATQRSGGRGGTHLKRLKNP